MTSLEDRIKLFYEKYAPKMLNNPGALTGIVAWTHNHGEEALNGRLKEKYNATLDDVAQGDSDAHWEKVREAMIAFYERLDPLKDPNEIEAVFKWTKKHGLFALNQKLREKYNEILTDVRPSPTAPNFRQRWSNIPLVSEEEKEEIEEKEDITSTTPKKFETQVEQKVSGVEVRQQLQQQEQEEEEQQQEQEATSSSTNDQTESGRAGTISRRKQSVLSKISPEAPSLLKALGEFFRKHDPEKPVEDIAFLANWANRTGGVDQINNMLRLHFAVGLEDVGWTEDDSRGLQMLAEAVMPSHLKKTRSQMTNTPGSVTSSNPGGTVGNLPKQSRPQAVPKQAAPVVDERERRRAELSQLLTEFYQQYEPSRLQPSEREKFDKVVTYGLDRGLQRLNGALQEKYGASLDDIQKKRFRQSLRPFLDQNDPGALESPQAEEMVKFGVQNGAEALDARLQDEYGVDSQGRLGTL